MLSDIYQSLNKSFKEKELVFFVGCDAGFFSEYNNMILAMLYCLENRIQFKICAGPTNFHQSEGWNGFFLPFSDQIKNNGAHYRATFLWKSQLKAIPKYRSLSGLVNFLPQNMIKRNVLLTQDVFSLSRNSQQTLKTFVIPELGINGSLQEACSKLIEITWRYNEETQKKIDELKTSINMPDNYIGFHIRGGDKFMEHKIELIEAYFAKVNNTEVKTAFVLTDDYSTIQEINRLYPRWRVETLCRKEEKGYFHADFLSESEELQEQKYLRLFASIDILAQADQFVGTYSSNPGMYLGMRNAPICTGVDFDSWKLW